MQIRTIEIGVGVFMLAGVLAMCVLALKVSGLSLTSTNKTYNVYALFDNTGAIKRRSKIAISGVTIGRVTKVELDTQAYMARIEMEIDSSVNNIPVDSSAAIVTAGLLGENYISISIGGESEFLTEGQRIEDTQSALILEDLIGKIMFALVRKKDSG